MASASEGEAKSTTGAAPGRRERNKLEKQARIVHAARELFQRKGFSETTTLEIAEAADVGTGTLFLYARSKEDLLIMVFKDEMVDMARAIFARKPTGRSTVDRMMSVFKGMIDYHARDIELSRLLLRELVMPTSPERRRDIGDLMDTIYDGLADIVRSSGAAGRIAPELAAPTAFALYYYALISWIGGGRSRASGMALLRKQLVAVLEAGN